VVRIVLIFCTLAALVTRSFGQPAQVDDQTAVQIEALNRLKGANLESNTALKTAVQRILEKTRGTPQFVQIVRDFSLKGHAPALLEYAFKYPNESSGVEAFRLALNEPGSPALPALIESTKGVAVVQLMANTRDKKFQEQLMEMVRDDRKPLATRQACVKELARTEQGARHLLDLEKNEKLPADLKLTAASELNLAPWPDVKKLAVEILPLPQTKNAEPLPAISELVKRRGDVARGRLVFESDTAACIYCHVVNGRGTDVGPQLSEIGTKLGKEALYQSILDPSSGISFGFEELNIQLKTDDELFGLITSETGDELTVKTQAGVVTKVRKADVAKRQKLTTSLMPVGLQLTMSTQELVDLVEYLASLKTAAP
jgi:putative heme-binding domain-containing protein